MNPVLPAIGVIIVLVIVMSYLKEFIQVCEPHEVLIFSGRSQIDESGKQSGFRPEFAGWHFRWPIIEKVDRMDMRSMPIEIQVTNALSKGGIPLEIQAIALVKISGDPRIIRNAIESFQGTPPGEIERVCSETLEGILRGIVSKMTPEEVNHDRIKFAHMVVEEVTDDLETLGLIVETIKIQSVVDHVGYLDSIGRAVISNALKDAEVAESDSAKTADLAEADSNGLILVSAQQADRAIAEKSNELKRIKAELEGQISVEVEKTEAAAREARANAEQKLQEVRTRLEHLRLQADEILPARARQEAEGHLATGQAAGIREQGRATAAVVDLMNAAFAKAEGNQGMDIFVLQKIDTIIAQLVDSVQKVNVGSVTLIDSGDGMALPAYVGSYPRMVGAVLREFKDIIGLDVPGALRDRARDVGFAGKNAGVEGAESAPSSTPVASVAELTSMEVLEHVVTQLARERTVGEGEKGIFEKISKLLAIPKEDHDRIVDGVLGAALPPLAESEKPLTPASLYEEVYKKALRDNILTVSEKAILTKLAKALGIDDQTRKNIQQRVGAEPSLLS